MIQLRAERSTLERIRAEAAAMLLFEDPTVFRKQVARVRSLAGASVPSFDDAFFAGKRGQFLVLYPPVMRGHPFILVGAGKRAALSAETLRRAAAVAAKEASRLQAATLDILEPDPDIVSEEPRPVEEPLWQNIGLALGEGAALALYKFDRYLTANKKRTVNAVSIISADGKRTEHIRKGLALASVLCEATSLARDLENAPANEIFPESLARIARQVGQKHGFRVTVLTENRIRALKMGGLLGVAQGSARPPRFLVMEYRPRPRADATVVLVGKGVTFDAGGISIKPSAGMAEMKMDMSGAATVIGTMQAAARLKLRIRLVGLVPATENLPGGRAMKPGDILRHYNGKTSEVDNTDAEGRLILADALSYAEQFKPDAVIDLATLTGAVVVALGHHATGMLGNDARLMARIKESGERTYERVWELPMFEEYEKQIKSEVADVKNVGGRWAGAITGALFLKHFIGAYPWVHLDIAGTAMIEEASEYIPRGGSGVGVRLLIDLLRHWSTA
jgi:leucyl aminopeptidase